MPTFTDQLESFSCTIAASAIAPAITAAQWYALDEFAEDLLTEESNPAINPRFYVQPNETHQREINAAITYLNSIALAENDPNKVLLREFIFALNLRLLMGCEVSDTMQDHLLRHLPTTFFTMTPAERVAWLNTYQINGPAVEGIAAPGWTTDPQFDIADNRDASWVRFLTVSTGDNPELLLEYQGNALIIFQDRSQEAFLMSFLATYLHDRPAVLERLIAEPADPAINSSGEWTDIEEDENEGDITSELDGSDSDERPQTRRDGRRTRNHFRLFRDPRDEALLGGEEPRVYQPLQEHEVPELQQLAVMRRDIDNLVILAQMQAQTEGWEPARLEVVSEDVTRMYIRLEEQVAEARATLATVNSDPYLIPRVRFALETPEITLQAALQHAQLTIAEEAGPPSAAAAVARNELNVTEVVENKLGHETEFLEPFRCVIQRSLIAGKAHRLNDECCYVSLDMLTALMQEGKNNPLTNQPFTNDDLKDDTAGYRKALLETVEAHVAAHTQELDLNGLLDSLQWRSPGRPT